MVQDAVLYNLAIIGEAARHIPEEICRRFSEVAWAKMRGMRNIVTHEYFGISLPIVWETVQRRRPELKRAIGRIRDVEPGETG